MRLITIMVLLSSLLSPLHASACQEAPIETADRLYPTFELPAEPDAVILTFNQDMGGEAMIYIKQSGPSLQVLADGTVIVHDPFDYPKVKGPNPGHIAEARGKLTPHELQMLLNFVITEQSLARLDSKAIRAAREAAQEMMADAGTTTVSVDLPALKHTVHVYDLNLNGAEFTPDAIKVSLAATHLNALRAKTIKASGVTPSK